MVPPQVMLQAYHSHLLTIPIELAATNPAMGATRGSVSQPNTEAETEDEWNSEPDTEVETEGKWNSDHKDDSDVGYSDVELPPRVTGTHCSAHLSTLEPVPILVSQTILETVGHLREIRADTIMGQAANVS